LYFPTTSPSALIPLAKVKTAPGISSPELAVLPNVPVTSAVGSRIKADDRFLGADVSGQTGCRPGNIEKGKDASAEEIAMTFPIHKTETYNISADVDSLSRGECSNPVM
jgi:hypothetical protein